MLAEGGLPLPEPGCRWDATVKFSKAVGLAAPRLAESGRRTVGSATRPLEQRPWHAAGKRCGQVLKSLLEQLQFRFDPACKPGLLLLVEQGGWLGFERLVFLWVPSHGAVPPWWRSLLLPSPAAGLYYQDAAWAAPVRPFALFCPTNLSAGSQAMLRMGPKQGRSAQAPASTALAVASAAASICHRVIRRVGTAIAAIYCGQAA